MYTNSDYLAWLQAVKAGRSKFEPRKMMSFTPPCPGTEYPILPYGGVQRPGLSPQNNARETEIEEFVLKSEHQSHPFDGSVGASDSSSSEGHEETVKASN